VKLPLLVANADEKTELHPQVAIGDPAVQVGVSLRGIRIMVVDDERDAREVLWHMLTERGASVSACASASEALAIIEKFEPDVLVSDIGMSDEDGYEFIRKVRMLGEPFGRIPAVALTGHSRLQDRTRALLAGFQAHLAKPVDARELVVTVASVAGRLSSTTQR
jgi:CheY-like chemotaxis protein